MGEDPIPVCRQSQCDVTWVLKVCGGWVDWLSVNSDRTASQRLVVCPVKDIPEGAWGVLVLTPILHCGRHMRACKVCEEAGNQWDVEKLGSRLLLSMRVKLEPW